MATNGIFSGDLTDGNEDVIEDLEAQDDGIRSLPAEPYACKRNGSTHFRGTGPIHDTPEHCTFCDGARTSLPADEGLPTEADFDALRASVPPAPKYDGPKLYRETNGEPRYEMYMGPQIRSRDGEPSGSHDFDEIEHARAVADVANDLRSRGARVSLPRRRRTRVRDRFLRWVFSVAEDVLEDIAERLIEAKMHLNVGPEDIDPWPEPVPLRTWDPHDPFAYNEPSVLDDFPELRPLADRSGLRTGVFKGGIGD